MSYKNKKGKNGEIAAEKYLKRKGYIFIARNYWTECGEIDLIFYKNFTLIFVEVKTRNGTEYGTGREAVNALKQNNIRNTAKLFMKSHCVNRKVPCYIGKLPLYLLYFKKRFDVIEISCGDDYKVHAHLKGFFK